jgi:hypothetical protein
MTEGRGERDTGTPDITIHDPDDIVGGVARGGGSGERATRTSNTIYNLSSVLFHAFQGGASYDTYIEDAEREGDWELADFFRRVRDEDSVRADDARLLLARRTLTAAQPEDAAPSVATMEGSEPDVPPGIEPRAEGAPSGDPRREYAVTETADEDPTPLEGAVSPRPEPSDDFPGTEPVRGDDSTARSGEVSPPKEVPPERAGEIPTAEEVPPPRAEEIPTGTQTQASPGDATSLMPGGIPHEGVVPLPPPPPKGTEESPTAEEERAGQQEEDKGLVERVIDKLMGEEEQRGEGTGRPDRR